MREMTYRGAIAEAIDIEMAQNPKLYILGEDIGIYGGVFKATKGLYEKYGDDRIIDMPISEAGIVGVGIGAAMTGLTMISEIMFSDLLCLCMDQIVNQAAKVRYMFGGDFKLPLVVRSATGVRNSFAAQHSQTLYQLFTAIPGIIVIAPSTPKDVKGLLLSALRCNNLVLFFEHKSLYPVKGEVPEGDYTIPIGKGEIKREGNDLTVVAISFMVKRVLELADKLKQEKGYDVEVIDPKTLNKLDEELLIKSVKKTNKLLVVDEGCKTGNFAAEIISIINEKAFDYLDEKMMRVTSADTPVPFSPVLEEAFLPNEHRIIETIEYLLC
jgi:pyruvate dehydrogenase E1 component beta subunit